MHVIVLTNDVYFCDFILFIVLIWYGTYVCVVSIVFQFALDMYTNLTFDMISKEINISARGSRLYSLRGSKYLSCVHFCEQHFK